MFEIEIAMEVRNTDNKLSPADFVFQGHAISPQVCGMPGETEWLIEQPSSVHRDAAAGVGPL